MFYIGQTCRPLTKCIKEHEACHRLNNLIDSATGNIKSTPTKHGWDLWTAWSSTSIITSCQHHSQLDLLEHATISTLEPSMNEKHKGPLVNACWHPLLDTIATSFVSKPTMTPFRTINTMAFTSFTRADNGNHSVFENVFYI